MDARRRGWLQCGFAAALFGATAPFAQRLQNGGGSVTVAGLLYLGAALAVLPPALHQPLPRPLPRPAIVQLSVAVVLGGAVAPVLLLLALERTSASSVSLLLNLELVASVLIARAVFKEHLERSTLAGLGLVLAGAMVLAGGSASGATSAAVLVAAACLCWGVDNNLTASAAAFTPAQVTLAKGLVAGSVNFSLGLVLDGAFPSPATVFGGLVVGSLGYGASITLWVTGARSIGAARGQAAFATAPFLGVIASTLLGDELVGTGPLVALVIAAVGVVLVARSSHAHVHSHVPLAHIHEHDREEHHRHAHDGRRDGGRHTHWHEHPLLEHEHAHVPDLHHRHDH